MLAAGVKAIKGKANGASNPENITVEEGINTANSNTVKLAKEQLEAQGAKPEKDSLARNSSESQALTESRETIGRVTLDTASLDNDSSISVAEDPAEEITAAVSTKKTSSRNTEKTLTATTEVTDYEESTFDPDAEYSKFTDEEERLFNALETILTNDLKKVESQAIQIDGHDLYVSIERSPTETRIKTFQRGEGLQEFIFKPIPRTDFHHFFDASYAETGLFLKGDYDNPLRLNTAAIKGLIRILKDVEKKSKEPIREEEEAPDSVLAYLKI